jgi:hypothetical protein
MLGNLFDRAKQKPDSPLAICNALRGDDISVYRISTAFAH